jgi:hypothetical protein
MKTKILITLEGGVIQNITATKPEIEISILDYDGADDRRPFVAIFKTDIVEDMKELFNRDLDQDELSAVNQLIELGFLVPEKKKKIPN